MQEATCMRTPLRVELVQSAGQLLQCQLWDRCPLPRGMRTTIIIMMARIIMMVRTVPRRLCRLCDWAISALLAMLIPLLLQLVRMSTSSTSSILTTSSSSGRAKTQVQARRLRLLHRGALGVSSGQLSKRQQRKLRWRQQALAQVS